MVPTPDNDHAGALPGAVSRWPHRLALGTALCAVPLVLFGGSVTTIGAGMAVEGWLVAEGHFLLFFPVESWFRDTATFVEHTHRLFGVLVGLFAIATLLVTWRKDPRVAARALAGASLLAVCAQGALGGFRVLENDPRLAFVHGALAQAVLALLISCAVYLSPRWRAMRPSRTARSTPGLRLLAGVSVLLVFGQIVLGALYRHALRPAPSAGSDGLFLLHALGAVVVLGFVVLLAAALNRAVRTGDGTEALRRAPARLTALLGAQILLGLVAWLGYRPDSVGPLEWGTAVGHVLVGGLLLAQCTAVWMWLGRLSPRTVASPAGLEGAA